ncbi:MAG: TonB-dependent receptor, partial [Rhodothermales bacterium]|nr:TonB-dependent receptor [Rhodothermales bacterium]
SGAIGGAISLRTADPDAGNGIRLSTTIGPWGERILAGRVAAGNRRIRGVLAAEAFAREGDFPYTDQASFPSTTRLRENADGSAQNVFGKLVVVGDRSTLEVAAWAARADRGLPGLAGAGLRVERQKDDLGRLWVRLSRNRTTFSASSHWSRLTYVNPAQGIDDTGRATTASIAASRNQPIGVGIETDVGVELSVASADHPALQSDPGRYGLRTFLLGRLDRGAMRVHPAVRVDGFVRKGQWVGQISPGLRIRLNRPLGIPVAVKAGLSTGFRAPTLNDLFWRGQGAVGNEDLQPERSISYDLGGEIQGSSFSVDLSAYYQRVRNEISWVAGENGVWSPENIGRVHTIGIEAATRKSMTFSRSITTDVEVRYTYTDSRDRSDPGSSRFGKPVRHVPAHLVNTGISSTWRFLKMGLSVRWTDRRYVTVDASEWLQAYLVADAHVSAAVDTRYGRFDLAVFVENLGGREYQIMSGYPMPPRHARLQLTATFK